MLRGLATYLAIIEAVLASSYLTGLLSTSDLALLIKHQQELASYILYLIQLDGGVRRAMRGGPKRNTSTIKRWSVQDRRRINGRTVYIVNTHTVCTGYKQLHALIAALNANRKLSYTIT